MVPLTALDRLPNSWAALPKHLGRRVRRPEDRIALCVSGGGLPRDAFHLRALWRLNKFGHLPKLARISSVSGGSITAALLGMKWAEGAGPGNGVPGWIASWLDARRARFTAVVCWALDRIGRDLKHLLAVLEDLQSLNLLLCR